MRRLSVFVSLAVLVGMLAITPGSAGAKDGVARSYVVLYRSGVSMADARAAIKAAGGTILSENTKIGVATVRSTNPNFPGLANASAALVGAARNAPIGYAPGKVTPKWAGIEANGLYNSAAGQRASNAAAGGGGGGESLAAHQWDMVAIDATPAGSYSVDTGSHDVLVGIIDTGIDASHPDLAANFNHALSRNFTTDIPLIDGSCASDPDGSCSDPADVDEGGHGSHVAGTVGAALNGIGISGVAPGVSLVNLRAGQDSGYFFLQPTLDAYTFAADNGIDVVNMSYFTDPWLFNCLDNPKDTPQQQKEQRVIREASQRALNYAFRNGVTLIAAAGNDFLNLSAPTRDFTSPDFPPGTSYRRDVDNSCIIVPTESDHVISVSATGPSGRKAYYSNYGMEQIVVAAPGGDRRDFFGTPQYNTPGTRVLSSFPYDLAIDEGIVNPDCTSNTPLVVTELTGAGCGVYAWFQGTSMASPHASGVAALIVSAHGVADGVHGGLTMDPLLVQQYLEDTATETPCPNPRRFVYPDSSFFTAYCAGSPEFNGFFGHGVVNALAAATS